MISGKDRQAVVHTTKYFGSGRVALKKGEGVTYDFYDETVWVYDVPPPGRNKKLLYTFGSRKEAGKYLRRI